MRSSSSPLLDNIETSYQPPKIPKSFNINAYGFDSLELLYNFDDIKSMHFYKVLSYETAISLYDFADRFTLGERAEKMLVCGNRIGYDENNKIVFANFCRQRLCPLCQRRRSLRVFSGFCRVLEQLSEFKFLHLVLTVPNCEPDSLGYTLDIMQKLSSRLFRLPPLKRAFKGIARCTEVSYNKKTDTFHPHFHCLVCVAKSYATSRDYVRHKDLRRWWSVLWGLRDTDRPERIPDNAIMLNEEEVNAKDLLQIFITVADDKALPEIAKYAVKPLEFEASRTERAYVLEKLFEGLHGRRLIQTYGNIKETFAKLNIDPDGDDEDTNGEPTTIFNWEYSCDTHGFGYFIGEY